MTFTLKLEAFCVRFNMEVHAAERDLSPKLRKAMTEEFSSLMIEVLKRWEKRYQEITATPRKKKGN